MKPLTINDANDQTYSFPRPKNGGLEINKKAIGKQNEVFDRVLLLVDQEWTEPY
jgi:hypothetical protein